jgi:phosphoglycerate dehydrogenase-like enzyme
MRETSSTTLAVAVAPEARRDWIEEAVRDGGGKVVPPESAEALIWGGGPAEDLGAILDSAPGIRWVQLPSAGIERYAGLLADGREWTCAKGIYAAPVAEHALALALAGLHRFAYLARARSWQGIDNRRGIDYRGLMGSAVTILGGGGIAQELVDLLAPFHAEVTVVRRHPVEMPGVARVVGTDRLLEALKGADVVVLALALTPETTHIIGRDELHAMKERAWLVNIGRGKLVQTDELVVALQEEWIGGAALDVTDPEPLPDGHPLWGLDNCLITPHCANPPSIERDQYSELIRDNVRRRIAGEPLRGTVDPELGY